jgi:hypothetical protein
MPQHRTVELSRDERPLPTRSPRRRVEICASDYAARGREYVAHVLGRAGDSLDLEYLGDACENHTLYDARSPGLYVAHSQIPTGPRDIYVLVWEHDDHLIETTGVCTEDAWELAGDLAPVALQAFGRQLEASQLLHALAVDRAQDPDEVVYGGLTLGTFEVPAVLPRWQLMEARERWLACVRSGTVADMVTEAPRG